MEKVGGWSEMIHAVDGSPISALVASNGDGQRKVRRLLKKGFVLQPKDASGGAWLSKNDGVGWREVAGVSETGHRRWSLATVAGSEDQLVRERERERRKKPL
ncbi:UNVERIFIED_CONTAM: hypothetical protein Sindi_0062300 [Sesamum indicum]